VHRSERVPRCQPKRHVALGGSRIADIAEIDYVFPPEGFEQLAHGQSLRGRSGRSVEQWREPMNKNWIYRIHRSLLS
jgi:hypothetical protein